MGFGSVDVLRFPLLRILMERLNDHRHVHNQCARARGYVHVFDDKISPMMATKACKFASVRRSLNLECFIRGKSLVCINAECKLETLTVALAGAADIFVNWFVRR